MTGPTISREQFLSLLDRDTRPDPYPLIAQFPHGAARVEGERIVVATSYSVCESVLRSPRFSVERRHAAPPAVRDGLPDIVVVTPPNELQPQPFILRDPPAHTTLRRTAAPPFSSGATAELEPMIMDLVDDQLDKAMDSGCVDITNDIAHPVGMHLICSILGTPQSDESLLRTWADVFSRGFDPTSSSPGVGHFVDPSDMFRFWAEQDAYFAELVMERSTNPRNDLISTMCAGTTPTGVTHADVVGTCELLIVAGQETTVNLISNGVLWQMREFGALTPAADDPESVVNETLRFDPPVQYASRIAVEDTDLAGVPVREGDTIVALLAAANRDPLKFDRPDVYDLERQSRNLAFGLGPHYCLGAGLARLEGGLLLQRIGQRIRRPRLLVDPPPYKDSVVLRGPRKLLLTFDEISERSVPW